MPACAAGSRGSAKDAADSADGRVQMGCCALACYCEGAKAYVANAGDCRAIIGRQRDDSDQYKCIEITCDHTASNLAEQKLVARRGPAVERSQCVLTPPPHPSPLLPERLNV